MDNGLDFEMKKTDGKIFGLPQSFHDTATVNVWAYSSLIMFE